MPYGQSTVVLSWRLIGHAEGGLKLSVKPFSWDEIFMEHIIKIIRFGLSLNSSMIAFATM